MIQSNVGLVGLGEKTEKEINFPNTLAQESLSLYKRMNWEIILVLVTVFFVVNTYYDGKYTKMLLSWKKYYKIAMIVVLGGGLYLMLKKNPTQGRNLLLHANNMVRYLPIDKTSLDMLHPIVDFTTQPKRFMEPFENTPWIGGGAPPTPDNGSPKKPTKRSVSETKKKYVASSQNWMCGDCGQQLNHTFEIDHRVRLEYGGTNDVNNLVALCRNCHGSKTAMENM